LRCQKKNAVPIEIKLSVQSDNAFEKAVLTIGTGSVTAGIILCLIVKPIRQTVKKKTS
jgi:hypothetical protein